MEDGSAHFGIASYAQVAGHAHWSPSPSTPTFPSQEGIQGVPEKQELGRLRPGWDSSLTQLGPTYPVIFGGLRF